MILCLSNQAVGAIARKAALNYPVLGVTWPAWPAGLIFDAGTTSKVMSVIGTALSDAMKRDYYSLRR